MGGGEDYSNSKAGGQGSHLSQSCFLTRVTCLLFFQCNMIDCGPPVRVANFGLGDS